MRLKPIYKVSSIIMMTKLCFVIFSFLSVIISSSVDAIDSHLLNGETINYSSIDPTDNTRKCFKVEVFNNGVFAADSTDPYCKNTTNFITTKVHSTFRQTIDRGGIVFASTGDDEGYKGEFFIRQVNDPTQLSVRARIVFWQSADPKSFRIILRLPINGIISNKSTRPNLIMIITDEHNLRTLGCYSDQLGGAQRRVWGEDINMDTPHLDRLAAEGALFSNYYTVSPMCTPSRASFMTGLYPHKTGISQNHDRMDDDMITFAQILKEKRGYHTAYFGKWHLNGERKPGWGNGERKFGFTNTTYQYNRGHWKFLDKVNGEMRGYMFEDRDLFKGREEKHYTTDYLFDRSIEFMDEAQSKNETFAMVISIPDPHAPNEVREPYENMYKHLYFNVPRTGRMAVKKNPATPRWNVVDPSHQDVPLSDANMYLNSFENSDDYQNHLNQYFGMVKLVDDNVGKLLAYLDNNGLADDTIVVFTSDHGDLLGEHGKYNKGEPYRTSAGVPFILRYPGKVLPGKVVASAFTSVDFAPSILDLMGVYDHGLRFDGDSFASEVTNYEMMTNYPRKKIMFDIKKRWTAALENDIKLVVSGTIPWLFDLQADPFEVINFFDNPMYEVIQKSLITHLQNAMDKHDLPVKNKIYWSKPLCIDSEDRVKVDLQFYTCEDIGKLLPFEKCSYKFLQQHCPVSCKSCCEDTQGEDIMSIQGKLRSCGGKLYGCSHKIKQVLCPALCNVCNATHSMQSIL